jgi:hypothetical protein
MGVSTNLGRHVKPGRNKVWHAHAGPVVNGVAAMTLTSVEGNKVEAFGYYVRAVPADFGAGYHLTRFPGQVEPGEPTEYHVNIDPDDPEHGHHECECWGHLRWGHKTRCKHILGILQLNAEGRLPQPTDREPFPASPRCLCGALATVGAECQRCNDLAEDRASRRADLSEEIA